MNPKTPAASIGLWLLFFLSAIVFISGCSDANTPTNTSSANSESGSLAIQVRWIRDTQRLISVAAIICDEINGVKAIVYNELGRTDAESEWTFCEERGVSFTEVPLGHKTVVVLARDTDGDIIYRGETNVEVRAGETASADIDATTFVPTLSGSFNGETYTADSVELEWEALDTQYSYQVYVAQTSDFSGITPAEVTTNTFQPSGLMDGRVYFWQVRAVDGHGYSGGGSLTGQFNTLGVPLLVAPGDDNGPAPVISPPDLVLQWMAVASASKYEITIDEDDGFSNPVLAETQETEIRMPDLVPERTYYWRVFAYDPAGHRGTASRVRSFFLNVDYPELVSPANNSIVDDPQQNLTWDAYGATNQYHIQISTSDTFSTLIVDEANIQGTSTAFAAPQPDTYYWRVRAMDGQDPISQWSPSWNFATTQCLGNWNPDGGCTSCLPGWTDTDGDHCGTLVRYVNIDNLGRSDLDGLTWSDALSAVQDGIDNCQTALQTNPNENHCEVWVAQGTYYIYQTANHNSVRLRPDVHLYGGFSGNETGRDQRNWTEHVTTLDGHMDAGSSERVEHVVISEQEGLLDGFVITGGFNQCDYVYGGGGGMFIGEDSRAVARNIIFKDNMTECNYGGGLYLRENSTVDLINCTFDNNESEHGGGMYAAEGAALRAESCVFTNNFSWCGGGAVQNAGAHTEFVQCQFIDNIADRGSAIYTSHTLPVLDLDRCLLTNNSFNADRGMPAGGGALDLNQTHATIRNSGFVDNKRTEEGSAIYSLGSNSILDISNSYFYQNIVREVYSDVDGGGAIYCVENQQVTLTNCTLVENIVEATDPGNAYGGGIYGENTPITITNCIIRNNTPEQVDSSNPSATITYSNVNGISEYDVQAHNIDMPVFFVGGADLHLLPHAPGDELNRNPCIDSGDGDAAPATDADGNPRRDDTQTPNTGSGTPGYVDMGAYEYQP